MAKLAVLDKTGKKVSDIELKDEIFAIEPNKSAMHLVVVNYLAISVRALSQHLLVLRSPAAAKSPGSRRAPAAQDRAQRELRSGLTAVSHSARSRVITALM